MPVLQWLLLFLLSSIFYGWVLLGNGAKWLVRLAIVVANWLVFARLDRRANPLVCTDHLDC